MSSIPARIALEVPLEKAAMDFVFPTVMFEVGGQMAHRLHRSKFLTQMAELYDKYAEEARRICMREDPQTERPPLERMGIEIIDTVAVANAAKEEQMTEDFEATMLSKLEGWRDQGVDPVAALRETEKACGLANEEFADGGKALVEHVYEGVFTQGAAGPEFTRVEIELKANSITTVELPRLTKEDLPDLIAPSLLKPAFVVSDQDATAQARVTEVAIPQTKPKKATKKRASKKKAAQSPSVEENV